MPTITLSISQDIKEEMKEHKEINWSEIARKAITEKMYELKLFNSIIKKSKLTEKDAIEISKKINKGITKKTKQESL